MKTVPSRIWSKSKRLRWMSWDNLTRRSRKRSIIRTKRSTSWSFRSSSSLSRKTLRVKSKNLRLRWPCSNQRSKSMKTWRKWRLIFLLAKAIYRPHNKSSFRKKWLCFHASSTDSTRKISEQSLRSEISLSRSSKTRKNYPKERKLRKTCSLNRCSTKSRSLSKEMQRKWIFAQQTSWVQTTRSVRSN